MSRITSPRPLPQRLQEAWGQPNPAEKGYLQDLAVRMALRVPATRTAIDQRRIVFANFGDAFSCRVSFDRRVDEMAAKRMRHGLEAYRTVQGE